MKKTVRLLFSLFAALPSAGIADDTSLARCRAVPEPMARLQCYDALPLPAAPGKAPGAAPPAAATGPVRGGVEQFGLEHRAPAAQIAAIETRIPGHFEGWGPGSRIRLANGQVWQIADDSARYLDRVDPKVTIRRGALGAFYLDIEGDNRSPRVKRVQ